MNAPEAVDHVVVRVGVGGRFLTCLLQLEILDLVELQRRLDGAERHIGQEGVDEPVLLAHLEAVLLLQTAEQRCLRLLTCLQQLVGELVLLSGQLLGQGAFPFLAIGQVGKARDGRIFAQRDQDGDRGSRIAAGDQLLELGLKSAGISGLHEVFLGCGIGPPEREIAVRKRRRGQFADAAILADVDRIDDVERVVTLDWRGLRGGGRRRIDENTRGREHTDQVDTSSPEAHRYIPPCSMP